MKDQVNNNDYFISKLIKKSGADKAPPGFTDKVMANIERSEVPETYTDQPLLSPNTWLLLAAASVAVIAVVLFVDWSFLGLDFRPEEMDAQKFKNIIPYIQGIFQGFGDAFAFLTRSSIPAIILIGTLSLVALDRILRKFAPKRSYMF